MAILLAFGARDAKPWMSALREVDDALDLRIWPDCGELRDITFVIAWYHPAGLFSTLPNLRCVQSLGAGVDHILRDPLLPPNVAVARIVDKSLARSMAQYVTTAALNHLGRFPSYQKSQLKRQWQPLPPIAASQQTVGIMGLGRLGATTAHALRQAGFTVQGWSRSPKKLAGIKAYSEEAQLPQFLANVNILVCLLPLTPTTTNILNAQLFAQLPRGAYVINVGRGSHLVEDDLLAALDCGQLSGACLDVFRQEPLPIDHPFWQRKEIIVTPHISSVTDPQAAARQIVVNYRRLQQNQPLLNIIDRARGY